MPSIVGSKGQIVIEKAIRDALSVQPGHVAIQRLVGRRVEIVFLEPEHDRSLRGILADAIIPGDRGEDWSEMRDQAWAEAVAEEWSKEHAADA